MPTWAFQAFGVTELLTDHEANQTFFVHYIVCVSVCNMHEITAYNTWLDLQIHQL